MGIAGIDTRKLTRILRERGAQNGCLMAGRRRCRSGRCGARSPRRHGRAGSGQGGQLQQRLRLERQHLGARERLPGAAASRASTSSPTTSASSTTSCACWPSAAAGSPWCRRRRRRRTCSRASPTACSCPTARATRSRATTRSRRSRELSCAGMPTFGICLGHQLLAWRRAARTLKMKFGHHGANHPVQDMDTGQVLITSQNHGFAVDPATLPANAARHARVAVRRHPAGHRPDRPAGVLLPGPPRSEPRAARHRLPVRPLHQADGDKSASLTECRNAPTSNRS